MLAVQAAEARARAAAERAVKAAVEAAASQRGRVLAQLEQRLGELAAEKDVRPARLLAQSAPAGNTLLLRATTVKLLSAPGCCNLMSQRMDLLNSSSKVCVLLRAHMRAQGAEAALARVGERLDAAQQDMAQQAAQAAWRLAELERCAQSRRDGIDAHAGSCRTRC